MKILVVASVLDIGLPFGCTPAWWQLLKALHEAGTEVVATPYHGRPVASLWWRTYDNPCYGLGATFASLRGLARRLPFRAAGGGGFGGGTLSRRLVDTLVKPRWKKHLFSVCEREPGLDAVLILTVPLNHLGGLASEVRQRFGVPVCYYDGDVPASLPGFGGFASGFNMYEGADLSEYDLVLCNSQGGTVELRRLGALRAEALWWGADPGVFRPVEGPEDVDVFFYGLGAEYREDWLRAMITVPSQRLPDYRFVVAGNHLDLDLGRAERVGALPPAQLGHYAARARLNLNVARSAHAGLYASATTRLFELAAMGRAVVTNPLEGLHEWFAPGQEVAVVHDADEAVAVYRDLLEDGPRRLQMGRAARERVLRQHTYAHRARRLLELLGSLRGANGPLLGGEMVVGQDSNPDMRPSGLES